jgi:hypothetical protein
MLINRENAAMTHRQPMTILKSWFPLSNQKSMRIASALILLLFVICVTPIYAQTTVALMPIPKPQFFGQNGQPLPGCRIYTYISGTSTPQGTFFDSGGTIPNQNPVVCDAGGFVSIWLIVGDTYRIVVQDQNFVQQYIVDGVVGVGGGTLSLFSTPNTWTALQTFSAGANIVGGNITGTFTGSPAFSGTPAFTTFSISNATVIANLNASLWNGTSVNAGGALATGLVPVTTGGATAAWGNITQISGTLGAGQLPGSGVITGIGGSCTVGSSCNVPFIVFNTPSGSTNANIGATTIFTAGGSDVTIQISEYIQQTVVGTNCTGATSVNTQITWQDPLAAAPATLSLNNTLPITGNNNGAPGNTANWGNTPPTDYRIKAGTVVQYSTIYTLGTACTIGPSYKIWPYVMQIN